VDTYELSEMVKDVIFGAEPFTDWYPNKNATDIAFFKDGECWFGTTVHEYDMWIAEHEEEFELLLDDCNIEYSSYKSCREELKEPYVLK